MFYPAEENIKQLVRTFFPLVCDTVSSEFPRAYILSLTMQTY